jgi:hypothetical protein
MREGFFQGQDRFSYFAKTFFYTETQNLGDSGDTFIY